MKPCPFCGGDAEVVKGERPPEVGWSFPLYAVRCVSCGALGPWKDGEEEARQAWDIRVGEPKP